MYTIPNGASTFVCSYFCAGLCLPIAMERRSGVSVFIFPMMRYQPLVRDQVVQCMKGFVKSAIEAIKQLHRHGYVHNDLRLPNMCFDETFQVVLIDFDRVERYESSEKDWHCFGSELLSLQWDGGQAWKHFVAQLQYGNEPILGDLEDVQGQDQVSVEAVLRRRN